MCAVADNTACVGHLDSFVTTVPAWLSCQCTDAGVPETGLKMGVHHTTFSARGVH